MGPRHRSIQAHQSHLLPADSYGFCDEDHKSHSVPHAESRGEAIGNSDHVKTTTCTPAMLKLHKSQELKHNTKFGTALRRPTNRIAGSGVLMQGLRLNLSRASTERLRTTIVVIHRLQVGLSPQSCRGSLYLDIQQVAGMRHGLKISGPVPRQSSDCLGSECRGMYSRAKRCSLAAMGFVRGAVP